MKKKLYLIIVLGLILTTAAAIGGKFLTNVSSPVVKLKKQQPKKEQQISKAAKEYLSLVEKFMTCKNLSFKFDYTVFAGENLDEIAEHFDGNVCKADTLYKMITQNSELVVDSFLSVSIDHESKKIMVTWSNLMDRRYSLLFDIKEMTEVSSEMETVIDEGKTKNGCKTYKISTKENKGYVLIDLDSTTGFPRRLEILRPADGIETFDDTRLVINYSQMSNKPVEASEFSYSNYIEIEPEFRVKKQFSTYELLTNL